MMLDETVTTGSDRRRGKMKNIPLQHCFRYSVACLKTNDRIRWSGLHYITLQIFKGGLSKNFKDHRAQHATHVQYNVRIRLPKQMSLQFSSEHQ